MNRTTVRAPAQQPGPSDTPPMISVPQAAIRYGVDARTIRKRIQDREVPALRIGRIYRVDLAALDEAFGRAAADDSG